MKTLIALLALVGCGVDGDPFETVECAGWPGGLEVCDQACESPPDYDGGACFASGDGSERSGLCQQSFSFGTHRGCCDVGLRLVTFLSCSSN